MTRVKNIPLQKVMWVCPLQMADLEEFANDVSKKVATEDLMAKYHLRYEQVWELKTRFNFK